MELIKFESTNVLVEQGNVFFDGFDKLKDEAAHLADHISQVEVTEDNIKQSKKLLATVNNRVKELENTRISVKKQLLQPYAEFESQVKEIVEMIGEANTVVRNQVRELEELERQEKKKHLEGIFTKRVCRYSFGDYITFDKFLRNQHLNKTYSIDKVEQEMVDWLEGIKRDLTVLDQQNKDTVHMNHIYFNESNMDFHKAMSAIKPISIAEPEPEHVVAEKPDSVYEFVIVTESEKRKTRLEEILSIYGFNYRLKQK